jgi:hypothetical protein
LIRVTTTGSSFAARGAIAVAAVIAAAVTFSVARAEQTVVVIPLHVEHSPYRVPHLGIDVTIGSVTKRLEVDTSSPGLRILAGALPAGDSERTGQTVIGDYGNGLNLRGIEANAPLWIGGLRSDRHVQFEAVESIACATWSPKCAAAKGGVPDEFGRVFPGVLGLMITSATPGECCVNPLFALERRAGHSYLLHADFSKPSLTLSPDAATIAKFSMAPLTASSWPTGCVVVKDVEIRVCGEIVIDTGLQDTVIQDPAPAFQGIFAGGTVANLSVGSWKRDLTAGGEGDARYSMFSQRGDKKRIVLGLGALQEIDVYFDLDRNQIGFLGR